MEGRGLLSRCGSLLLILVVTPVIFAMLRERELQPQSPATAKP
jgi:hypothetical protein